MSAPITVLALLMASQASALPMLYNQKGACTLPTQGFGQHLAPINDTGLTFALSDASGPVAEYQPNGSYTLKVTYSAPVHIWLVTSAGAFSTQTASLGCNGATAFMGADAATSFEVTWNAPETCTPVTVSANAAKSAADNYRQATIPVSCSSGSTSNSTTPAGTPPAATTPTTPTTPSPATTPSPSPPLNGAASMVFSALAVVAALMALLM